MLNTVGIERVYLARGATDLRKAIDGLAALVQLEFELDPFTPSLFVFCNRKRDKVKILHWSESGFWLYYFRLEKGRLEWPEETGESSPLNVTWRELRWILDGLPLKPAKHHPMVQAKYTL